MALHGWSDRSRWGYDDVLESFWAELWLEGADAPAVLVGTGHLIPTLGGLARAIAWAGDVPPDDAFLALTA